MSLIEHVWPWDAQPQEAVRLRRELADAALVYLPGTHPTAILSASGLPIAPLTTAAPLVVTPSGYAVQQQQQSQFSRAAAGLPTNAPELTLWVVSANGAAYANSSSDRGVFGIAGGGTFVGFQNWSGGLKFLASVYYYPDYNGAVTAESASGVVRPNSTQIVVATYRRNDAVRLYVGGVKVAESAAGNYDGSFNLSTMSIGNSATQMTGTPAAAGILLRALSDSDIATMFSDPWSLFEPRRIGVPVSGGGGAFEFTGSGGLQLAGSAAFFFTGDFAFSASGGVQLAGEAQASHTGDFIVTPAGGLQLAGSATSILEAGFDVIGSGGLSLAGAADAAHTGDFAFSASGGLQLTGTGSFSYTGDFAAAAAGGITFSGIADASVESGFVVTGSGGLQIGGAAVVTSTGDFVFSPTGGLQLGGEAVAIATGDYAFTMSGGLQWGGAATASMGGVAGDCPTVDDIAAAVWAYTSRRLTAGGNTDAADAVWAKVLP